MGSISLPYRLPLSPASMEGRGGRGLSSVCVPGVEEIGRASRTISWSFVFSKGKYFVSLISHYTQIQIPPVPVVRDTLPTSFHTWILQVRVQDSLLPRSLPWFWLSLSFFIQSDLFFFFSIFAKSWCSALMPSSLVVSYHLFPCPHCKSLELTVLAREK